ncbi:hypothetical protein TWF694_004861 [Orbilia ellipsospora]|uniref:Methyltransferase type 12 domain-containing protein n=1 Tax=Orbilia ellipsospora TaxID=2528407 RepID=A0AAV9WTX8_9PEZI
MEPTAPTSHHLPTMDAYDLWAAVYDTDGNVLQQLDDIYVDTHLPALISSSANANTPPVVAELGCGTGRNTIKLARSGATVLAVDNSRGMLEKLQEKLLNTGLESQVRVYTQDLSEYPNNPDGKRSKLNEAIEGEYGGGVDGVLSTLVIEHLDIDVFFKLTRSILKPGGWVFLTNMHADMGLLSSAGFMDPVTGKKVKPVSINHPENEILEAAGRYGFELVGNVSEDGPTDAEHASQFGKRAHKWIGVKMHIGMVLRLQS